MKRNAKMLFGATRVAMAAQRYQPNRDLTSELTLAANEVPGMGWTISIEQDMPAHSFNKGEPEMIRAKQIKSTTSKRLYKNSVSKTVLIEITPLATTSDAESWVSSSIERVRRQMLKYVDLDEFEVIDDIALANVGSSTAFRYGMTTPDGVRESIVVASNVGNVYTIVTCTDVGRVWSIEEVLRVVHSQVEKIRIANVSQT